MSKHPQTGSDQFHDANDPHCIGHEDAKRHGKVFADDRVCPICDVAVIETL